MKFIKLKSFFLNFSIYSNYLIEKYFSVVVMLLVFVSLYDMSISDAHAYSGEKFKTICQRVLDTVAGKFGSLLTATAGIGALVSSAAGGFRMAWSLLVVAIGSFTLKTYQEIWFAPCGGGN